MPILIVRTSRAIASESILISQHSLTVSVLVSPVVRTVTIGDLLAGGDTADVADGEAVASEAVDDQGDAAVVHEAGGRVDSRGQPHLLHRSVIIFNKFSDSMSVGHQLDNVTEYQTSDVVNLVVWNLLSWLNWLQFSK